MLKRKWITDEMGRLIGVWIDSPQVGSPMDYFHETAASKKSQGSGYRRSSGRVPDEKNPHRKVTLDRLDRKTLPWGFAISPWQRNKRAPLTSLHTRNTNLGKIVALRNQ